MSQALNQNGYAFFKLGRPLICLQQSPILFTWLFLVRYKILKLYALGVERITGIKGLKALFRYRYLKNVRGREVWLPVFGHMALKVHRGYKVFDFRRKVAIRVIDQDVAYSLIKEELTGVKTAASLDFAPNTYRWNEKQRWYEEEYIVGDQKNLIDQSSSSSLLNLFHSKIASCLEDMLKLKSIQRVETRDYLKQISKILDDSRLINSSLDVSKVEEIKSFLSSNIEQLMDQSKLTAETFIAFSHGDFSLVNILSTEGGIKVIDWEGAKHRGLLNDFFNFFMTEIYYNRAGVDIAVDVNNLAKSILQSVKIDSPARKKQNKKLLYFYRRLYYVERIAMLLERDITDKALNVIIKSIDVFNRFERECSNLVTAHKSAIEITV